MKPNQRTATAAGATVAAVAMMASGCATEAKPGPEKDIIKVARAYQAAANSQDWRRACELSTPALRRGTVAECAARNTTPAAEENPPSPTPTPPASESADPSATPTSPTYGDGRTLPPPASPTISPGPDRASTGPVKAEKPVKVDATGGHPAGYGVLVTYTVTWPNSTTTARKALRLVKVGKAWRIEQHEDVMDGDTRTGDPVRAALSK